MNIEDIKAQIEERLYKENVGFSIDCEVNGRGDNVYHILVNHGYGIIAVMDGKFKGIVMNGYLVDWAEKEGFGDEAIDEMKIFIERTDVEEFLKFFLATAAKYRKEIEA